MNMHEASSFGSIKSEIILLCFVEIISITVSNSSITGKFDVADLNHDLVVDLNS